MDERRNGTDGDAAPLRQALALVTSFVSGFEPGRWSGSDAGELVDILGKIERAAGAGKGLAARRAAEGDGWRRRGHTSPAAWLASGTGESLGRAHETLSTVERLESCPTTEAAWRRGELSTDQAALVSSAAVLDPAAEERLLTVARQGSHDQLRRDVRAVKAAARADHPVDVAAIHRSRYLRHWTADDGAFEGRFRLAPDKGALVMAGLDAMDRTVFEQHRIAGDREAPDAYRADALVALARAGSEAADSTPLDGARSAAAAPSTGGAGDPAGTPPSSAGVGTGRRRVPAAVIRVRVDHAALVRGHLEAGEVCEIEGIGPVPLGVVRRAAGDAVLRAVLVDGERVLDVRHAGRTLPSRLREALDERDPCCVVPGCGRRRQLEYHHLEAYRIGGEASLANMARVCTFHHDQITYEGAEVVGQHPTFRWRPPGEGVLDVASRPIQGPSPPAPGLTGALAVEAARLLHHVEPGVLPGFGSDPPPSGGAGSPAGSEEGELPPPAGARSDASAAGSVDPDPAERDGG